MSSSNKTPSDPPDHADLRAQPSIHRFSDLPTALGMMWIVLYAATWSTRFSASAVLAIFIFALLTYFALSRRDFWGGRTFGRYPLVPRLALLLWMDLAWRAVCSEFDWPHDSEVALPVLRVGALLARSALHTLTLGILFAYPLRAVFSNSKWYLCCGLALGEALILGSPLFDASTSSWTRVEELVDMLGLAVGLPYLVRVAFPAHTREAIAHRQGQSFSMPASRDQGPIRNNESLCRTAHDSEWLGEDLQDFRFFCATSPPRWGAVARQLRVDFADARIWRLVLVGIALMVAGLGMRSPAVFALGCVRLAFYGWALFIALRVGVAAPIRFGVVTLLDGHPSRKDLVTARALCDDGSTVNVVAHEAFVGDLLSRHGQVMVAFLHRPRDEHALVLAAKARQADHS